ncbi:hypothetical protein [Pseudomonas sp. RW10S2]|uniref:hypothetical protein n=1 Tax=Pseudomonas sp. RW10S2 TaxID=459637 RepID=UPI00164619B9|nr:hypothetical protein [Pseudomonas sp. RW10S2]MBC3466888.1 hypothetical protein [Pseudomonas sp. RW10S2]
MTYADHTLILIGQTVLLVPPGIEVQQREDALDSLHYCQLLANKHAGSCFDDPDAWAVAYRQGFESLNWIRFVSAHDWIALGPGAARNEETPLLNWLKQRKIDVDAVLATLSKALTGVPEGLDHLLRFAVRNEADTGELHIEFGLLGAGPILDLCSVSLRCEHPITRETLAAAAQRTQLQGELAVRALSLNLSKQHFASQRSDLHNLILDKEREKPRRLTLGVMTHE